MQIDKDDSEAVEITEYQELFVGDWRADIPNDYFIDYQRSIGKISRTW